VAHHAPAFPEREDRSLDIYLREIRRTDLLTASDEASLAQRIRRGDRSALDALVAANLRFVVSVARGYAGRGLPFADLVNEGNVGLVKAAERFDETRGCRFISYAVWWIRQSILQALAEQPRVVRLPLNRAGRALRIDRTAQALAQRLGREPTDDEIARAMGISVPEVDAHRTWAQRAVSLDAPAQEGLERPDAAIAETLADRRAPSPEERVIEAGLARDVRRAMRVLDRRERKILDRYFGFGSGEPTTLEAIGRDLGITRERVRQLKDRAMGKIRGSEAGERLRSYTLN
jgi:RNA polymerase primary sigma factor